MSLLNNVVDVHNQNLYIRCFYYSYWFKIHRSLLFIFKNERIACDISYNPCVYLAGDYR